MSTAEIDQIIKRNEQLTMKNAHQDHDEKFAEYERKILGRLPVDANDMEQDLNISAQKRNEAEAEKMQFEQEAALRRADPTRKSSMTSSFDLLLSKLESLSGYKFEEEEISPIDYETMRRNDALQIAKEVKTQKKQYYKDFIDKMRTDGNIKNIRISNVVNDQFNRLAYEQCFGFVKAIANKLEPIIQIVCGTVGTGKTTLCHVYANEYIDIKSKQGAGSSFNPYLPLVILTNFEDIKKTWLFTNGETLEERNLREKRFKEFCEVDLLILDGLCNDGMALDNFAQRVFSQLLRSRMQNGLPLLITTPYVPQELLNRIGENCYECIKDFKLVRAVALLGSSRRQSIDDWTGEKLTNEMKKRLQEAKTEIGQNESTNISSDISSFSQHNMQSFNAQNQMAINTNINKALKTEQINQELFNQNLQSTNTIQEFNQAHIIQHSNNQLQTRQDKVFVQQHELNMMQQPPLQQLNAQQQHKQQAMYAQQAMNAMQQGGATNTIMPQQQMSVQQGQNQQYQQGRSQVPQQSMNNQSLDFYGHYSNMNNGGNRGNRG